MTGQEMFLIQQAVEKKLGGLFGLSQEKRTELGIALDAAACCGWLMHHYGTGGFSAVPTVQLEALLHEKMQRLGVKVAPNE